MEHPRGFHSTSSRNVFQPSLAQRTRASIIGSNAQLTPPERSSTLQRGQFQELKNGSQIWLSAIQKYYDELEKGGFKGPAIDKDLWNIESPMELLDQIRALEPSGLGASGTWLGSLPRLESVLLSLNDFMAVIAWALGMNGRVAAVVWGSIRLILKVSSVDLLSLQHSC